MTSVEKIFNALELQRTELIELMKKLVSIKAIGPINNGDGESEKADFIIAYLKTIGFNEIEEYPAADPQVKGGLRPNLIARIPGKNRAKTVWIMGHLDVVPEGDISKWTNDPYEAVVRDGKIFGRGTEDNNQALVSSLILAKCFFEQGITPEYDIALLFVADEETGSKFGLNFMVENHGELFSEDDLYIIPDAGEPDGSVIEVAEKSILWIKFKTIGVQAHASLPNKGVNAFKASSHLVVALENLYQKFPGKNPVFDPETSTFAPTKKSANVPNINTLPGEDVFYMDCRVLPRYKLDDVLKEIKCICKTIEHIHKVKIEITLELKEQAAPATPVDAPVVLALQAAIAEIYNVKAKAGGIGGGTVAATFRKVGFDAAVWATIDDLAHQPDEYAVISNIINDAKVLAHVCLPKMGQE